MRQPADLEDDRRVEPVYDKLRTSRLNVKYYGCRLALYERVNFWLELSLAVFTSSAVAGLTFWSTSPIGKTSWAVIGFVTSLALVVKPFLPFTKRIKGYEAQLTGHQSLEAELIQLKDLIQVKQKFDRDLQAQFRRVLDSEKRLIAAKRPEPKPCRRVMERCMAEVNRELPADHFFFPKEDPNGE